jgi:hypothetical protein
MTTLTLEGYILEEQATARWPGRYQCDHQLDLLNHALCFPVELDHWEGMTRGCTR